jgi:hypothetical protein
MNNLHITENSQCHLWSNSSRSSTDLQNSLKVIKTYTDQSHLIRYLKQCQQCPQLYFYEFYEEIDWIGGNDPQYRTWIPIDDQITGDQLNLLNHFEIQQFRRIIIDWPKDQSEPGQPQKII